MQNDVLAGNRAVQASGEHYLDGGGHLKPCHAFGHAGGHIGRTHTGGECAYRTVSAGMAVGTDDAVTGGDNALFGQKGMFNTHLAYIVEVQDVVFVGKFPALFGLGGTLDILIGHKVVQHDVHAGLVKDGIESGFFKLIDGHGGGNIVAQHDVELGIDELARLDGTFAAVGGQNLLGHGHSHDGCSFPL